MSVKMRGQATPPVLAFQEGNLALIPRNSTRQQDRAVLTYQEERQRFCDGRSCLLVGNRLSYACDPLFLRHYELCGVSPEEGVFEDGGVYR